MWIILLNSCKLSLFVLWNNGKPKICPSFLTIGLLSKLWNCDIIDLSLREYGWNNNLLWIKLKYIIINKIIIFILLFY